MRAEQVLKTAPFSKERIQRLGRGLRGEILQAEDENYKFISRELHDSVAQSIAAVKLMLERLETGSKTEEQGRVIRDAVFRLGKTAQEVRGLSRQLRPEVLDEMGLISALDAYCRDFQVRTGIRVEFACDRSKAAFPANVAIHLYRIVQEALNNVLKHANAGRVALSLDFRRGEVVLSVVDDGDGFVSLGKRSHGLGLISLQERTNLIEGILEIVSRPGKGTKIEVKAPLPSNSGRKE